MSHGHISSSIKNGDILRLIKKISVLRVTGRKILVWVGTHNFFSGKKYNFMHFELSKCIKLYFSRKLEKNSRFHQ